MTSDIESVSRITTCSVAAGLLGHFFLNAVMKHYRKILYDNSIFPKESVIKEIGEKKPLDDTKHIVRDLGILERFIYAGRWLSGFPQIIAVVLALKIAPSLRELKSNNENTYSTSIRWTLFNMYVVGNFLSLILAILFAEIFNWLWLACCHCLCN